MPRACSEAEEAKQADDFDRAGMTRIASAAAAVVLCIHSLEGGRKSLVRRERRNRGPGAPRTEVFNAIALPVAPFASVTYIPAP